LNTARGPARGQLPEFDGPGKGYSPEDFFGLAIVNCFAATFKVIAEKSRLSFDSLSVEGRLAVDRDEKGRPCMKSFLMDVKVSAGANGNVDRILRVLDKTSESCIVVNSVKTEVRFSFAVS
jgi:uncharacterized OsmC-like protein